ncbi:MAG: LysE family translocator [Candidatus Binatia bacterium]
MSADLFLKGLLIGFMVAVPVGPVGVFCINRFLMEGIPAGLVSGFGIATADALASSVALVGLTLVANFLASHQEFLRIVVGILLCSIGARTILRGPVAQTSAARVNEGNSLVGSYVTTFFLTFANPVTVASFLAVFVGFGLNGELLRAGAMTFLITGVFFGSALWWMAWAVTQRLFPAKLTSHRLWWFNTVSGVTIAGFGCVLLIVH